MRLACAVVSEDTIAKAAAQSHADDGSGSAARGSVLRHRRSPQCSAEPLPALHPSTRQLDEHHAGHAIHHAEPRGHMFVTPTNWRSRWRCSEPPTPSPSSDWDRTFVSRWARPCSRTHDRARSVLFTHGAVNCSSKLPYAHHNPTLYKQNREKK